MMFWCYCIERRVSVINATIRVKHLFKGKPTYSRLMGKPTDITSICEFGWYNWLIYRVEGHNIPFQHKLLRRALGPSNNSRSAMSKWVLTGTGNIMPIQTMRHLKPDERSSPVIIKRMKEFDDHIKNKYRDSMSIPTYQSSYRNVYPEHDDELPNADSGDMENIYVTYEG